MATFDSSDLRLRWPPQLFLAVTQRLAPGRVISRGGLDWLLAEAFVDSRGLSVDAHRFVDPPVEQAGLWLDGGVGAATQLMVSRFLMHLVDVVGDGSVRPYSPPLYYRARRNPSEAATAGGGEDLGAALCAVLLDLDSHGYFDDAFGPSCCDARADRPGVARELFEQLLGPETPWQWLPSSDGQDLDHVYDLVEVCHDLVSRPRIRTLHGFCEEWDYDEFDRPTGRLVYVWRVNAVLGGAGVELRLSDRGEDEGRLVHTPLDPRSELPSVVAAAADPSERGRVEHAVVTFRSRHATRETKRDAVRALGDVLERRRSEVKDLMTRKDEGALFQILNEFDIRHLNQATKEDYDELFIDWVYWTLLASLAFMDAKKAASVVPALSKSPNQPT